MKRAAVLFVVAFVLATACTKQQLLVVTHTAASACEVVEVVTADGLVRGLCLAVEALDRLLADLFTAKHLGVGVVLVVARHGGGEERHEIAADRVEALAAKIGAIKAARSR